LECLAVVWSVKLFRPYLYGRAFGIITDHAALKWLMTRPNLAGRLHRWSLTLQEYEFTIEYRPGTTNVVADALSRAPDAVRAVVGERRRPGRPAVRTRRPDAAMKMKTEDDEPVTTPVSRGNGMDEAMAAALAALGTTGETAKLERMVAAERRKVPEEGNGSAKSSTPWPVDRPLTRAAKRRLEEAAAATARAADSLALATRGVVADGVRQSSRPRQLAEDESETAPPSSAEAKTGVAGTTVAVAAPTSARNDGTLAPVLATAHVTAESVTMDDVESSPDVNDTETRRRAAAATRAHTATTVANGRPSMGPAATVRTTTVAGVPAATAAASGRPSAGSTTTAASRTTTTAAEAAAAMATASGRPTTGPKATTTMTTVAGVPAATAAASGWPSTGSTTTAASRTTTTTTGARRTTRRGRVLGRRRG